MAWTLKRDNGDRPSPGSVARPRRRGRPRLGDSQSVRFLFNGEPCRCGSVPGLAWQPVSCHCAVFPSLALVGCRFIPARTVASGPSSPGGRSTRYGQPLTKSHSTDHHHYPGSDTEKQKEGGGGETGKMTGWEVEYVEHVERCRASHWMCRAHVSRDSKTKGAAMRPRQAAASVGLELLLRKNNSDPIKGTG